MKKRATIEVDAGAIRPIGKGPWVAAVEQLDAATGAINAMKAARDRIAYEAAWGNLLDALELFWARLNDEGSKASTRFSPWIGSITELRRSDPLLQYLKQARHKNQHERAPLEWSEGRIRIDVSGGGVVLQKLKVFSAGQYEAEFESMGATEPRLIHEPGHPVLPTIENRGVTFPPPQEHLAQTFEAGPGSPLRAAEKGLAFYSDVMFQVMEKFPRP